MSVYLASFFAPQHYHGKLFSIAAQIPKGFKRIDRLDFLIPTAVVAPGPPAFDPIVSPASHHPPQLQDYRNFLGSRWKTVKQWLYSLDPQQDLTLLCEEEPSGQVSYRQLVAQLIQSHRPDCWGGCDVLRVELPRCQHCGTTCIPGLDANFCPHCRVWEANSEFYG
uniref:Uncharacterized protein n=1 Tax=Cyanothece sp. (strain PCC 7425 / ATCC 29141) TaxID=395961 RepID=B8HPZ4_CYAP4